MGATEIKYKEPFGIGTFKREISGQLGETVWDELTRGAIIPDAKTERLCGCENMAAFMERFDSAVDRRTAKKVLSKVRHGLMPEKNSPAREKFLKLGDLDAFIERHIQDSIADFEMLLAENKDFYGQPVTGEVVDFVKRTPAMLAGRRENNVLFITQFPARMQNYIQSDDPKMKRYHACHCPFAKESILAEKTVSSTLCYCSLGHAMNFWEEVFDTELEGEVLTSALMGDETCTYAVTIPEQIMAAYVKG